MFQRQWLILGGLIAAAVVVSIVFDRSKVTALTPTLSFKPTQTNVTGGVVSNVSDASSGLPGAGNVDLDDEFYPD
jgi:hypothetical protein